MRIKGRKRTFVLVIPSFEDVFHSFYASEIIKGVSITASRIKVDILIRVTDRFDHKNWVDASLLDRNYVDGIVFADIDNDVGIVKKAIAQGMPTVVLNNYLEEPFNCISIDNEKATKEIVRYLVKQEHKKIATVAGDATTQAGEVRLSAFKAALKEADIKVPSAYITRGDFLRTPARIAAEKLLKLTDRPTAIFAASDVMALEVLDAARANAIRVPEDLSVFGFDDNPLSVTSSVPLSTVAQPLVEMGRVGAEKLYQISLGKAKLPVKDVLPAKLVHRKSVGKCR